MKIISWNVNGIRAVERKNELQVFLEKYDPDILLIQETKAKKKQLSAFLTENENYEQFYHEADKAGYAGTAIWIKKTMANHAQFSIGMPSYRLHEGRMTRLDFDTYTILNIYFPNGGKSETAWFEKLAFYDHFLTYINELRDQGRKIIWAGDVNCAHEAIDLARPKENDGVIGFHPKERAWISRVIESGWADVFRKIYPEKVMYSWWHLITRARTRNVGWRIDYFFVDEPMLSSVKEIQYLNDQMGSDHCPVKMEIEII